MPFKAAATDEMTWASRTYGEISDIGDQDGSILLLPIGSIEQHGHHLPVATDTILVDSITELGVNRVQEDIPICRLPPFWSGYSPHHLEFGGTVSLEFEHILSAIEDIIETALKNGFDAAILVNGHGGNKPLLDAAVSTTGTKHDDVEVLGLTYFELATDFIDDIRDSDIGGMAHAGEFETSLLLHLDEDLVHTEEMKGTYLDEPYDATQDLFHGGRLAVYRGFEEYSASGAIGDPNLASASKGKRIYELLGDEFEELLRSVHERNNGN